MKYIFFLSCCFYWTSILAQNKAPILSCSVESHTTVIGELFHLNYSFEYDYMSSPAISDFEPPEWVLEHGTKTNTNRSTSYINGKSKTTYSFLYKISFPDTGNVVIPAATYDFNGQLLTCDEHIIKVLPSTASAKAQFKRDHDLSKKILLEIEYEDEPIYIGNQVVMALVVYTQISINQMAILNTPAIDGTNLFHNKKSNYVKQFSDKITTVERDGIYYKRSVVGQYIYEPLHAGSFELEPILMEVGLSLGGNIFSIKKDTIYSTSEKIEVHSFDAISKENLAKNGDSLSVNVIDSLLDDGRLIFEVELWGSGNSMFYRPLDLNLSKEEADVKIELTEDDLSLKAGKLLAYRKYRYQIDFKQNKDYVFDWNWKTWQNENQQWKTLTFPSHKIKVEGIKIKPEIDVSKVNLLEESDADIVFVVDVSTSMLAQDFGPNRLGAVKYILGELIGQKLTDQRAAIIIFAGDALLLCPLTKERTILMNSIGDIQIGLLPSGTAISTGLMVAIEHLENSRAKQKNIVIFTDGVQNMGYIDPNMVAEIACQRHISIQAIGVGTNGMAKTPISKNFKGELIYDLAPVEIDEALLARISEQTCGSYARIAEEEDLKQDLEHLLTKNKNSTSGLVVPTPMIDMFLEEVRLRSEKTTRKVEEKQASQKLGTKKEE